MSFRSVGQGAAPVRVTTESDGAEHELHPAEGYPRAQPHAGRRVRFPLGPLDFLLALLVAGLTLRSIVSFS